MKLGIFFLFCVMQSTNCNSKETLTVSELKEIVTMQGQEIAELRKNLTSNSKLLKKMDGYLTPIGLSDAGTKRWFFCIIDGWEPIMMGLSYPYTCVKVIDRLGNHSNARFACRNELQSGVDIEYPRVLLISSERMNDRIVRILEKEKFVSSIWLSIDPYERYTNYGNSTETSYYRGCVELKMVGERGKLFHVDCLKKNSIICERRMILSYPELVRGHIDMVENYAVRRQIHVVNTEMKFLALESRIADLENKTNDSVTFQSIKEPNATLNISRHRYTDLNAVRVGTLPKQLQTSAYVYDEKVLKVFPDPFIYGDALAMVNSEVILVIDGLQKPFRSFNTSTLTTTSSGILKGEKEPTSASVYGDSAILFRNGTSSVKVLNLTSMTSQMWRTNLPRFTNRPSVVSDGTYSYILGGYKNSSKSPTNALIRFDPVTYRHEFLTINNFPGRRTDFAEPSIIFVEKLNRIYVFGGYNFVRGESKKFRDTIWYVELGPSPAGNSVPCLPGLIPLKPPQIAKKYSHFDSTRETSCAL